MSSLKRLNLIVGWSIFLLTTILYWITMAPSASLWDCGEFISCMVKMEVGHPPGAPFYLLLGRFFNLFAIDKAHLAYTANLVSVFSSSATIMLMYFSVEHMLRRIFSQYTQNRKSYLFIIVPAAIGSLAFAVSDTFWFSAVEAEVYALSMLFTALCFWLFLKWEEAHEQNGSGVKWLVLIAYLTGLSVGVHLLNLLIIPVLILIILLRRSPFSWMLLLKAVVIGGVILGVLLFGVIQNGLWLAEQVELITVNGMGLPKNSGLLLFAALLFGLLFFAVFKTRKKNNWQHLLALVCLVFLIGYSSYAQIIIRSGANTPINLNDPSNVFTLNSFLNREQYAQSPLLYGQYYNAQPGELKYKTAYRFDGKKYESYEKADQYEYDPAGTGFFPRMHSSNPTHIYGYQMWAGIDPQSKEKPSFASNLKFFFNYQINHMYFRYFMWNFSGRQNDEQGHGDVLKGNWITGIPFLDRDVSKGIHHSLAQNNPSRNRYFLLPLLVGLIGIIFLIGAGKNGKKYLAVTGLLFLMTGPVIILYLNQTPFEPRERDYAFAGSFFAFALFISFGAFAITHWLKQITKSMTTGYLAMMLLILGVPVLMLSQNFDDHNRNNRYFALNMARSYLASCEPNAILFTYGDNDTYPVWYVQEVEGFRTDVRVINYGLMGADWCIRQLASAANDAGKMPFTINIDRYKNGDLDNALVMNRDKEYAPLMSVVRFIGSDNEQSKLPLQSGQKIDYSPIGNFALPYDDQDTVKWTCPKRVLYKNDIALLDMLATNNWKRPIYFTAGADPDIFLGLKDYLRYEGMVYQLVPKAKLPDEPIYVDTDVLFNSFMNNIQLGDGSTSYYDNYCRRTFEVMRYRQITNMLMLGLLDENKKDKAIEVAKKGLKELPIEVAPDASGNIPFLQLAYEAGMKDEATQKISFLLHQHLNNLYWFNAQSTSMKNASGQLFSEELEKGRQLKNVLGLMDNQPLLDEFTKTYSNLGLTQLLGDHYN
nr:DUF2723 domain-containing protein [uncultured Carboxylicivirga sp.]